MNWKKLQNGSDIRGVALEGIEGEAVNLTAEVVKILGKAFVQWLMNRGHKLPLSVSVGSDSRLSGPALKEAFIAGMAESGARVNDCGLASTPAMFMTTVLGKQTSAAGVMLTASHLPFNRNGLKFFTPNGGLDKKDITEILSIAEERAFQSYETKAEVAKQNFIDDYAAFLVDYIRENANISNNYDKPLQGVFLPQKYWINWEPIQARASSWNRMAISQTMSPTRKIGKPCNPFAMLLKKKKRIWGSFLIPMSTVLPL